MKLEVILPVAILIALAASGSVMGSDETPSGQGLTEANMESQVLDDMEDVSDWYNGSPDETAISASDSYVRTGQRSLCFANRVDHTKGEEKYPVGWPRTGKDLKRELPTDWSDWDFFECWIYATTSRTSLPKTPLGVGFYHTGHKRSTHIRLNQVAKNQWVRIIIPTDDLLDSSDVQRIQFNISESDYQHDDRVDFFIDQAALTRYIEPAVAEVRPMRKVLYDSVRSLTVQYKLAGRRGLAETTVEVSAGQGDQPAATATGRAARQGEIVLPLEQQLPAGMCWVRLGLRDAERRLIDQQEVPLRVIPGPFTKESER